MFPRFFKHKMREVGSFLKIMKGKATGNDQERIEGVNKALKSMDDERRVYEEEKKRAEKGAPGEGLEEKQKAGSNGQDKVSRESGGHQDISAI